MVILYGYMSKCDCLPRNTALEDVWLALDMLPRFRWRWERKDANGAHPLIAKLAERVMNVNLSQIHPVVHGQLMCELRWEEESTVSPLPKSQQSTPTLSSATQLSAPAPSHYIPGAPRSTPKAPNDHDSRPNTPSDSKKLLDVPTVLFYPFFPESYQSPSNGQTPTNTGTGGTPTFQDYSQILAAAAQQEGSYGCQSSSDLYMSEERESTQSSNIQMWMNVVRCALFKPT